MNSHTKSNHGNEKLKAKKNNNETLPTFFGMKLMHTHTNVKCIEGARDKERLHGKRAVRHKIIMERTIVQQ